MWLFLDGLSKPSGAPLGSSSERMPMAVNVRLGANNGVCSSTVPPLYFRISRVSTCYRGDTAEATYLYPRGPEWARCTTSSEQGFSLVTCRRDGATRARDDA